MPRAWLAALCLAMFAIAPASASASRKPYSVDDLLALEGIGQVKFDPAGKLLVVERHRRYDTAADYGYGAPFFRMLSSIWVTDSSGSGRLTPLFPQERDAGYWSGDFSPSGRKLAVFRLRNRQLDLGIVDVATRSVQWLDVVPDMPLARPFPSWLDDDTLIVVAMKTRRLPFALSLVNAIETDLPPLWAAAAAGRTPSSTVTTTSGISSLAGERQVVRIDLPSGRSTLLATGRFTDAAASSSGNVAMASEVATVVPPQSTPLSQGFVPLRYALDVVSAKDPAVRFRVADDVLPSLMAWNDAGDRLAYVRMAGPDWGRARFEIASLRGVEVERRTIDVPLSVMKEQTTAVAHGKWAGGRFLFEGAGIDDRAHWFVLPADGGADPTEIGDGQLVSASPTAAWLLHGGRISEATFDRIPPKPVASDVTKIGVTPSDFMSVGVRLLINPTDPQTVAIQRRADGDHLLFIGPTGIAKTILSIPKEAVVTAADDGRAVITETDEHGVGLVTLLRPDGSAHRLLSLNDFLADRDLPSARKLTATWPDGTTHANWLLLPSTPVGATSPPLVVIPYPGKSFDAGISYTNGPAFFAPMTSVPILVGHGFAVLLPSVPPMKPGPDPIGVLARAADASIAAALSSGLVDRKRVAVLGQSFGGFAALALAERSSRYSGIVAASGPYDLASIYGQMAGTDRIRVEHGIPFDQSAGWAEDGQAGLGVPPWTDPQLYVRESPFFGLDRVHAPVLLLHGEIDVVGLEQAEAAFMGLARLGRDATLVRYWGEEHVLSSPANIRDYWGRILPWLDERFSRDAPPGAETGSGSADGQPAVENSRRFPHPAVQ